MSNEKILIWNPDDNPRFSLWSDGEYFVAEIQSGGVTMSMSYSSVLHRKLSKKNVEDARRKISWAVQVEYEGMSWPDDLSDSIPFLLQLAKVADKTFERA